MIYGKLFYKGSIIEAGIEVEDGRIKKIGKLIEGRKVKGLILPAGIDVHVHFRDFKESYKETIKTGSLAALHGGVALVVDQPNTKPVVDNADTYFERMRIAERDSCVDYFLNLGLTRRNADKIAKIVSKIRERYFLPAIGEVFLQHTSEDMQIDYQTLRSVGSVGVKMTIHAEDPSYVSPGNPNFLYRKREAEILAVRKCLEIGNFHFCHISTRDAAELVYNSKSTFEVTPHHLLLTINDYNRLKELVNVNPPLRTKFDAEWLLENFCKADVLASDHAPHTIEDKKSGSPGFPGVETMYPIFMALVADGLIKLGDLVEKIAANPAKIFGFKDYGEIEVGKFANFAVFDLKRIEKIKAESLHSKCGWTPFEGFKAIFPLEVYVKGKRMLQKF